MRFEITIEIETRHETTDDAIRRRRTSDDGDGDARGGGARGCDVGARRGWGDARDGMDGDVVLEEEEEEDDDDDDDDGW